MRNKSMWWPDRVSTRREPIKMSFPVTKMLKNMMEYNFALKNTFQFLELCSVSYDGASMNSFHNIRERESLW